VPGRRVGGVERAVFGADGAVIRQHLLGNALRAFRVAVEHEVGPQGAAEKAHAVDDDTVVFHYVHVGAPGLLF
jgi:hypothetical protein